MTVSPRVWPDGRPPKVHQPLYREAGMPRKELGGRVEAIYRPGLDGLVRVLWTIPKTPPSLNVWERMHWSARNRTKKSWEEYLMLYARRDSVPPSEWVFVSAQIVFRKNAHRDASNFDSTFWKIFPDVLQNIGVLSDDTDKEMKRGTVALISDKKLMGIYADPRLQGFTRIALIAKPKENHG